MTRPRVYVGMSGGVDSSIAAALLLDQDYDVTGVYMKNWSQDLPGMQCPWAEDLADAKRVAVQLGIDFKVFDFETQYRQKVVDYMLDEYRAGRTPNPDIMCNQEVKFKLFLETSLAAGADYIATGHYARVERLADIARLLRARDDNKDQTYFLYRVTSEALAKTIFPLGNLTKPEVRQIAKDRGLWTARKKESMGVCFVGNVGIRAILLTKNRAGCLAGMTVQFFIRLVKDMVWMLAAGCRIMWLAKIWTRMRFTLAVISTTNTCGEPRLS